MYRCYPSDVLLLCKAIALCSSVSGYFLVCTGLDFASSDSWAALSLQKLSLNSPITILTFNGLQPWPHLDPSVPCLMIISGNLLTLTIPVIRDMHLTPMRGHILSHVQTCFDGILMCALFDDGDLRSSFIGMYDDDLFMVLS